MCQRHVWGEAMSMSPRLLRPRDTAFSPRSIPGLALWLDASDSATLFQNSDGTTPATASSDPVGYWGDKSGNGRHLTQATANLRGLVFTSSGRTRVDIPATLNSGFSSASPTTSSSGTVIQAGRFAGNSGWLTILRGDGVAFVDAAASGSGAVPYDGAGTPSFFVQGAPVAATRGTLYSGLNDVNAVFSATNINFSTWSSGWRYYNFGSSFQFIGEMGEVLVYNRALTTAERQRAERYLAARWGITLAPQVSNADAQDWINRVYSNGGTVSSATASAVNQFCVDIENAPGGSIRDRFLRLNLFAGTGLNACLTPLYRAASLGDTQLGNTTDTNEGGLFVSANYIETGVSGGLAGSTASAKRLRTGLAQNAMPTGNVHLAAYNIAKSTATNDVDIGARSNAAGQYSELLLASSTTTYGFNNFSVTYSIASDSAYTQAGAFMLGSCVGTAHTLYKNGSSAGTSTAAAAASTSSTYSVFSTENEAGAGSDFTNARLGGYSIGLSMTAAQAAAYYTAMQSFQTALTRNV